jgi:hypothetical protein
MPLTEEDIARNKIKEDFVNNIACQSFRLDQMFTQIKNENYNGDVKLMSNKDIGKYLKLIQTDIIKEHSDEMMTLKIEPKSINGLVSQVAREYFIKRLNDEILV